MFATRLTLLALVLFMVTARAATLLAADDRRPDFADFDRRALAGEHLNIVFFGASLTWGANATDPQVTSYRADTARRFEQAYPQAHFKFFDGAIGGTGSQLGVFRLDRDVFNHHPDLVFLDFSANDDIHSTNTETLASYEAILRRIILEAHAPVVQVIFPFQWDTAPGNTNGMPRRDAHLALSLAYHTAVGDAIALSQERVKAGQTTLAQIWPSDGVHPGNAGYELFTDAAWNAYRKAVSDKLVCTPPEKMIYAPTYMHSARVRITSLGSLPQGWHAGTPNLTSAFFDMLMSRWLDDEAIASTEVPPAAATKPADAAQSPAKQPGRLRVKFNGAMVMLFGESTSKSGKYRIYIDGKVLPRRDRDGKAIADNFDASDFPKNAGGNVHLVQVLAEHLDESVEHSLEIEPLFADGVAQELRLESICVAGGRATVKAAE